jgi:choline dehydrogenase-like flavoprotein
VLYDLAGPDEIPADRLIADVCVIGAGAAGLTLARALSRPGCRVLVLEAGGRDYEPEIAALGAGQNLGFPYYEIEDSRLRFFGGSTAVWGGRCAELDEIDFETREWVPHSGWPFAKRTLASHYAAARRVVEIEEIALDGRLWRRLGVEAPSFAEGFFETRFWQFDDRWDRFGFRANADLIARESVSVVLHATVAGLVPGESGAIESAELRAPGGRSASARARVFVLAAGGLENPRILLASQARSPRGVGNERDLVGRFFMEHPHARGGALSLGAMWTALRAFKQSHFAGASRFAATLVPSEKMQREHALLNSSFTPKVRLHRGRRTNVAARMYDSVHRSVNPTRAGRTLWRTTKDAARALQAATDPLLPWLRLRSGAAGLYLSVRGEQAPNPDSRVVLTRERDALGIPKLALDWRFSELDKRTLRVAAQQLDAELRFDGAGAVTTEAWLDDASRAWDIDPLIGNHPIGGYHHMGTTRMHADPARGVVDENCRVHGAANLFVAGSSVFPTSGWANPTLTILALTLRLADHLAQRELR